MYVINVNTMNHENNRLASFLTWPANAMVDAAGLAKAGFYYCGEGQRTKCFKCGVIISDWSYADQAILRHRQAQPDCPFVIDPKSTGNVPLNSTNERVLEDRGNNDRSDLQRYRRLSERLESFVNWPASMPVSPEQLANAGFYYLGVDDMVECAYCKGVIGKWNPGENPDQEHRLHFPNCDFYMRYNREEEPLETNNESLINNATEQLEQLGIQTHTRPAHPKCATYEYRLKTFKGWPKHLNQTPELLAAAGFYYIGPEDCVRCFHCDGGLINWEANDDAWVEHARWFPRCGFVSMVQGQKYIKMCIENRPPLDNSALSDPFKDLSNEINMPSTSSGAASTSQVKRISDSELDKIVNSIPALTALKMGLNVEVVKMVVQKRLQEMGVPYSNVNEVFDDARRVLDNQNRHPTVENRSLGSSSPGLAPILNQISNEEEEEEEEECNSIVNNDKEQISHSSNDIHSQNDAISNGITEDEYEKKHMPEEKIKEDKSDDIALLLEEVRRLKEARLCKICMDREVTIVFLPCGHLVTCVFCVPSLTHCPMCRENIRATVRTFLA